MTVCFCFCYRNGTRTLGGQLFYKRLFLFNPSNCSYIPCSAHCSMSLRTSPSVQLVVMILNQEWYLPGNQKETKVRPADSDCISSLLCSYINAYWSSSQTILNLQLQPPNKVMGKPWHAGLLMALYRRILISWWKCTQSDYGITPSPQLAFRVDDINAHR